MLMSEKGVLDKVINQENDQLDLIDLKVRGYGMKVLLNKKRLILLKISLEIYN